MPVGGENVGTAYVRILADGDGLPRSIREEFDKADGEAERAGEEHGERYEKGFDKAIRKKGMGKDAIQKELRKQSRLADAMAKKMGSDWGKNFEDELSKYAKSRTLGRRMFQQMQKDAIKSGDFSPFFESIAKDEQSNYQVRLRNMGGYLDRALKEEARAARERADAVRYIENLRIRHMREVHTEALRINKSMIDEMQRQEDEAYRLNRKRDTEEIAARRFRENAIIDAAKRKWAALDRLEDEARREQAERLRAEIRDVERNARAIITGNERVAASARDTRAEVRRLSEQLRQMGDIKGLDRIEVIETFRTLDRDLGRAHPGLRRMNAELDVMAVRIGSAFGKGARNDFVNFFGGFVEKGARLMFLLPKLTEQAMNFGSRFAEGFSSLPEGASMLARLGAGASAAGIGLTTLAAAGVGLVALTVIVGTVVAAFSMLLGIITALAASITYALIGSLTALAGALVPVAAGVGVLVGAIAAMSDEQKKMVKEAIKPFVSSMKEIGSAAADAIFGGKQFTQTVKDMTAGLASSQMKDLVTGIADAIGDVGAGWAKSMNSKGFRDWLKAMGRTVPDQLRNVGAAVGNAFGGLGGLLLAAQPLITRFTEWLEKITAEFTEWANSAAGQKELEGFFQRAGDSAKSLGEFLEQITGLIGDLFSSGKESGDNMFDSMADAVERFRGFIDDGGLEKWFKDAEEFAYDLGEAFETLGTILDLLDNDFTRFTAKMLVGIFGGLGDDIKAIEEGFKRLKNAIGEMPDDPGDFFDKLGKGIASGAKEDLNDIADGLRTFGENLQAAGKWMLEFDQKVTTGVGNMAQALGGFLLESIRTVAAEFARMGASVLTNMANMLDALPDSLVPDGWISGLRDGAENMEGFANRMDDVSARARRTAEAVQNIPSNPKIVMGESGFNVVDAKANKVKGVVVSTTNREWVVRMIEKGMGLTRRGAEQVADAARDADGSYKVSFSSNAAAVKAQVDALLASARAAMNTLPFIGGGKGRGSAAGAIFDNFGVLGAQRHTVTKMARGGFANFAQQYEIGESGREAIVPLDRPLGQVDPAVRALAAFAQGKMKMDAAPNGYSAPTVGDITVITPTEDPHAVAREVLDEILGGLL